MLSPRSKNASDGNRYAAGKEVRVQVIARHYNVCKPPYGRLRNAAKRYRVDTERLQRSVAKEFAAKRDKKTRVKPRARNKTAA
jgi:hypothetical protein